MSSYWLLLLMVMSIINSQCDSLRLRGKSKPMNFVPRPVPQGQTFSDAKTRFESSSERLQATKLEDWEVKGTTKRIETNPTKRDQEVNLHSGDNRNSPNDISDTNFVYHERLQGQENGIEDTDSSSSPRPISQVWDRLKYSDYYGKIRVAITNNGTTRSYKQPPDIFRCNHCLCFKEHNTQVIYADCKKYTYLNFSLESIPQDLPHETVILEVDDNSIKRFQVKILSRYKHLRTFKAPRNQIGSLRHQDCPSVEISLRHLNLSHNIISEIEDYALSCMTDLTNLFLRGNRITHLRNNSLAGLVKMKVLDLAENRLSNIQPGAFLPPRGLLVLNLSFNRDLILSSKHVETFRPLTSLTVFHIQGCKPLGVYPTEVLLALPSLKELFLNGEVHPFDPRLHALRNLTRLKLGTENYCFIKNFSKSYFSGLVHLKQLTIKGCRAREYSPFMFDANPLLTEITIIRANQALKTLIPVLCYLPDLDKITSVTITHTVKHSLLAHLVVLSSDEVNCLSRMKNLIYLNLDQNALSHVDRQFTMGLPASLKTFSLRGNLLISFLSVLFQVINLPGSFPNLKKLYEDRQGVDLEESRSGANFNSLPELESDIYSEMEENTIDNVVDLNSVEAQRSLLATRFDFYPNKFSLKNISSRHHGPKITYLDVYTASRTASLSMQLFDRKSHIQILDLSSTLIKDWGIRPVTSMSQYTVRADLSNNRCQFLQETFFKENNSLIELHLQGNFLGPLLSKNNNGSKLSRLRDLEYLDLSRNHLFTLPWLLFQGLSNLRILKLTSNNINIIDIRLIHMTSLMYVDLSKNSISSISERTRDHLDHLAANGNISIDLTYNPLPCTCDGLELFSWMSTTRVRILYKDFLVCENSNKAQELVGDLPHRVLTMERDCISKKILIMACTFAFVLLLLLTAFVWVFQNRWWIIYMRNRAISHFYGHRKSHKKPASPYTFDAFFVYAASGCDFVLDECLEELEENRGHRLCVEDRDFLAGSYVPCNITSAVRSSRTTVVVLDEHFRAEGWVQYAVEMAQVEAVRSKRDVLHLLFVGSPPDGCLPGAYLKVLRQGRFSEVPPKDCRSSVQRKFWDGFSQLLGHSDKHRSRSYPPLDLAA